MPKAKKNTSDSLRAKAAKLEADLKKVHQLQKEIERDRLQILGAFFASKYSGKGGIFDTELLRQVRGDYDALDRFVSRPGDRAALGLPQRARRPKAPAPVAPPAARPQTTSATQPAARPQIASASPPPKK